MALTTVRAIAAVATTVLVTGCQQPFGCTANFVYGLTIVVTDSATGEPLGGQATVVEVRDGAYEDQVTAISANTFVAAGERAGEYAVRVRRIGYRDWARVGVRVRGGSCHVTPVTLNVRLQAT
jgi:hypothetical protein